MTKAGVKFEGANWEITAISLRCDYIGNFVTVLVNPDWSAKCTWYLKYKSTASKEQDTTIRQIIAKCVGPDCLIITKYRDRLIEEEAGGN